ncbi:hypothetical protein HY522_05780 [bacterium]|nr:hypothetical protein [bacterium]
MLVLALNMAFFSACGLPPPAPVHPAVLAHELKSRELPLAQSSQLYAVADLINREIQIKIRGVILQTFPIRALRTHRPWESPAASLTLRKKRLASPRDRTVIEPPRKNGDSESVVRERVEDSLEADDMPDWFLMQFKEGARLLVLPELSESASPRRRLVRLWRRGLFALNRIFSSGPAVTLVLSESDARALYWTIQPDQKVIVLAP